MALPAVQASTVHRLPKPERNLQPADAARLADAQARCEKGENKLLIRF